MLCNVEINWNIFGIQAGIFPVSFRKITLASRLEWLNKLKSYYYLRNMALMLLEPESQMEVQMSPSYFLI